MEYHEIITAYEENSLDISDLKQKLETAKLLKGRPKYRAVELVMQRADIVLTIPNTLVISEVPEQTFNFEKQCNSILDQYYNILLESLEKTDAWEFLELCQSDYEIKKFKDLTVEEKFQIILDINKKYFYLLQYQKIADIRDCLKNVDDLDDITVRKLEYLIKMFESLNNEISKKEFYLINKDVLMALVNFRKSKFVKIEDYIKTKRKSIYNDYKSIADFFSTEDLKDIAENLFLTSKTLKTSVLNIIEAFSEMSETVMEIDCLLDEYNQFKKLEAKNRRMQSIKREGEENLEIDNTKEIINESKVELCEEPVEECDEEHINNKDDTNYVENERESINFILFFWLDREEKTLKERIGSQYFSEFFNRIKELEIQNGIKSKLFLLTNSSRDITQKRFKEIREEAESKEMPKLIEGALGGYGSFKIDSEGNLSDLATMSEENREKIIKLMENFEFIPDIIKTDITDYIRYQFPNPKDRTITMVNLVRIQNTINKNLENLKQPVTILPFMEGSYYGFDVLLKSQIDSWHQLPMYCKTKYYIEQNNLFSVKIDKIKDFINKEYDNKSYIENK